MEEILLNLIKRGHQLRSICLYIATTEKNDSVKTNNNSLHSWVAQWGTSNVLCVIEYCAVDSAAVNVIRFIMDEPNDELLGGLITIVIPIIFDRRTPDCALYCSSHSLCSEPNGFGGPKNMVRCCFMMLIMTCVHNDPTMQTTRPRGRGRTMRENIRHVIVLVHEKTAKAENY